MLLKIVENKSQQFSFTVKEVCAFANADKPIDPKIILNMLSPPDPFEPDDEFIRNDKLDEFGMGTTIFLTDIPIKKCYCITNEGFRIINFTGTAYVVTDNGDTINKF